MGKIGAMDIEDLATVVASWPLSESYILLKAMILSLRLEGNSLWVIPFFNHNHFSDTGRKV